MVALVPQDVDGRRLLVAGYEPLDELHMTLGFLGPADDWDDTSRAELIGRIATIAKGLADVAPVTGKVWATAHFNPTGEHPAAVYLVGGRILDAIHDQVSRRIPDSVRALNHSPWIPHLTIGYGLDPSLLTETGRTDITFDRLRVAFGDERVDLPIGPSNQV